jgi:hypothetical protein
MATRSETITYRTDDLDGTEESGVVKVENVRFAIDGKEYEIDLRAKNANDLRRALAKFVKAARPVKGTSTGKASSGRSGGSSIDYSPGTREGFVEWAQSRRPKIDTRRRPKLADVERYKESW